MSGQSQVSSFVCVCVYVHVCACVCVCVYIFVLMITDISLPYECLNFD